MLTFTGCLVRRSRCLTTLKLEESEKRVLALQVDRGVNISWTSSCGRLFDVVAALGGGCLHASYEAQGAIEMEMVCRDIAESYPYDLRSDGGVTELGRNRLSSRVPSFHEVALDTLLASVLRGRPGGKITSLRSEANFTGALPGWWAR